MFFLMVATLSYPENTAKSSIHYCKSFPGTFKSTQPFTSLIDIQSKLYSLGFQYLHTHTNEHLCAKNYN